MSILDKKYLTKMSNGQTWAVPVRVIAENRAQYYAAKDGVSVEKSLNEDTLPLFESDDYEVEDWAQNNLNWDDVKHVAELVESGGFDWDDGWINGDHDISD